MSMKFKITKLQFGLLKSAFDSLDNELGEVVLEPVIDTATQAIYEQQIKNEAFRMGIEHGYREGFYEGRCPEKKNKFCYCHC